MLAKLHTAAVARLEAADDRVYDLYFCFYQNGPYDLWRNNIHDVVSRVGLSRRQVDLAIPA